MGAGMHQLANKRLRILVWTVVAACLLPLQKLAAETAETMLIRQVLEKDRSGRRRGDIELTLSKYEIVIIIVVRETGRLPLFGKTVQYVLSAVSVRPLVQSLLRLNNDEKPNADDTDQRGKF